MIKYFCCFIFGIILFILFSLLLNRINKFNISSSILLYDVPKFIASQTETSMFPPGMCSMTLGVGPCVPTGILRYINSYHVDPDGIPINNNIMHNILIKYLKNKIEKSDIPGVGKPDTLLLLDTFLNSGIIDNPKNYKYYVYRQVNVDNNKHKTYDDLYIYLEDKQLNICTYLIESPGGEPPGGHLFLVYKYDGELFKIDGSDSRPLKMDRDTFLDDIKEQYGYPRSMTFIYFNIYVLREISNLPFMIRNINKFNIVTFFEWDLLSAHGPMVILEANVIDPPPCSLHVSTEVDTTNPYSDVSTSVDTTNPGDNKWIGLTEAQKDILTTIGYTSDNWNEDDIPMAVTKTIEILYDKTSSEDIIKIYNKLQQNCFTDQWMYDILFPITIPYPTGGSDGTAGGSAGGSAGGLVKGFPKGEIVYYRDGNNIHIGTIHIDKQIYYFHEFNQPKILVGQNNYNSLNNDKDHFIVIFYSETAIKYIESTIHGIESDNISIEYKVGGESRGKFLRYKKYNPNLIEITNQTWSLKYI